MELTIPIIWTRTGRLRWNEAEGRIEQLCLSNRKDEYWAEAFIEEDGLSPNEDLPDVE